jgi:Ca-activated chloride channel family protein
MRLPTVLVFVAAVADVCAQQPPVFHGRVDLVDFAVMVVDRQGKPVTGLTADDFEIYENGQRQALKYFSAGTPEGAPPLHLGLLLDTSSSMADDLKDARSAAIAFVNAVERATDVTLVDFDTQVRVARFGAADYPHLVERIRERRAEGWTALYDAIGVYLDGAQRQEGQKVLVVYTDGGDTTSSLTFKDVLDLVKASDVTVYAIGYLEHQSSNSRILQRADLERLAVLTGGLGFFPASAKGLEGVFDRIRIEIASRYSLGYVSTDTRADGAWRGVEVRLRRPDLKNVRLRTRSGYFAPYRPAS